MSVVYEGSNIIIGVEGTNEVERILGNLKAKTPAVAKVAVNSTARYTRREMIKHAKARYAVNAAGARHLDDLKKTKSATNRDISATLHIVKMRNDLGYFETNPDQPYMGTAVFRAPNTFAGRVLKSSAMKSLPGKGNLSKAFLLKFANNGNAHVGMVQRVIGARSRYTTTRAGHPRWKSRSGKIEKVQTLGSPSAAGMHMTIWPEVEQDAQDYLMDALVNRAYRVLELQQAKGK